jgi:hypothetical protein
MSIHHAFLLGPNERIRGLNLIDMEKEGAPSYPTMLPDPLLNIDSISESMGSLCLHTNEAQAFVGLQLHRSDHPRHGHELDTILGPQLA